MLKKLSSFLTHRSKKDGFEKAIDEFYSSHSNVEIQSKAQQKLQKQADQTFPSADDVDRGGD